MNLQVANEKLLVTSSPHIRKSTGTTMLMGHVVIALVPLVIAACVIFGFRALTLVAVCVTVSVLSEYLFRLILKRDNTVLDLSAVVTGIILALNLPVTLPFWMAAIGSVFAVVIVKQLFGGIGQNIVNPAAAARIFLLMSFATPMTTWAKPFAVDEIAAATPLAAVKDPNVFPTNITQLFLGERAGSLGEVCILAILIGGLYLIITGVIKPTIPLAYVGSVFVFATAFGGDGLYNILSGSVMFAAFYMFTDYTTSPTTFWGKIIFGVGGGLLTVIIRFFGSYPEGVSYSILLMNILVPYIDKLTKPKPFGGEPVAEK